MAADERAAWFIDRIVDDVDDASPQDAIELLLRIRKYVEVEMVRQQQRSVRRKD